MNQVFRLAVLVQRLVKEVGNVHRLHRLIHDANARARVRGNVSEHTLRRLADAPESASLSLGNMIALDNYLSPMGEGLQDKPILERRGITECLVDNAKVWFFVGAKPREVERRIDLSRWDTRSVAELVAHIYRMKASVQYEILDVLLRPGAQPAHLRNDAWFGLLHEDNRSLVSIGSPRANLASEVMLAEMFGLRPFKLPSGFPLDPSRSPFYFIWPKALMKGLGSAFAVCGQSLPAGGGFSDPRVRRGRANGFVVGSRLYPILWAKKRFQSYAVVVAQRRPVNRVWVVICGESGPATYAAATRVKELQEALPISTPGESRLLWLPIAVTIKYDRAGLGDHRSVVRSALLHGARIWPSEDAVLGDRAPKA